MEAEANVLFYAKPGVSQEYTDLAEQTAHRLQRVFQLKDSDLVSLGVSDFGGVYKTVARHVEKDETGKFDYSFICAEVRFTHWRFAFRSFVLLSQLFSCACPGLIEKTKLSRSVGLIW